MDEMIRSHVQRHLSAQFPGLTVTVRSARRVVGEGIEVRGIAISDPAAAEGRQQLVFIDELLAPCRTELEELLRGMPVLERLEIRRMRIHAVRREDGGWNLARLLPLPQLGACAPPAVIEDAVVEIEDLSNPRAGKFTLREINVQVLPPAAARAIRSAGSASGLARPAGASPPAAPESGRETGAEGQGLLLSGTLVGDHFRQVSFSGTLDPQSGIWSLRGQVTELQMSSRLLATLPGELSAQLAPLATLRARADLDFALDSPSETDAAPRFVISGRLVEGRFDDERLPYPLTDLRADLYCDSHGLRIDNLQARSGRTTLQLSFQSQGYAQASPFVVRAQARQLALDDRLFEVLPAELQQVWNDYSLGGTINVNLSVAFDGQRYRPEMVVECLNLSFSMCDFGYPMHSGRGTVRWRDQVLSTDDFQARAGAHWVHFRGQVDSPGPRWTGWLQAYSEGPVPIDETLFAALDAQSARVLRALRPAGTLRLVHARYERQDPDRPLQHELELELNNGTIEFEGFPYPIYNIQGKLLSRDGRWTFRDLVGRNDSAYIVCDGQWSPHARGGGKLELEFDCRAVPLEDELRLALDPAGQRFWAALRPRGTIDQLGIMLVYDSRRETVNVDVRAQQWAPSTQQAGGSQQAGGNLSIHPVSFPYRLDNFSGAVRYHDGYVEIQNVRARHGRTQVHLDGRFHRPRDEPWELRLNRLTADAVQADHDLVAALPAGLGQALSRLRLSGIVNLRGLPADERTAPPPALIVRGGGPKNAPVSAQWNLTIDVENGGLDAGPGLEHIRGGLQLTGGLNERGLQTQGELLVDSLLVQGVHLTRLRGPLWIDSSRIVLGAAAQPGPASRPPRPVTAELFGGQLAVSGEAALEEHGPFQVNLSLSEADLGEIARELAPRQRNISGRVLVNLGLRGNAQRPHTYLGGGFVRLRNADIYELPVMVALLKLLSVRRPDTTAFTSSDIDFRIQGQDVYFDPIDFRGDAISLLGKGWMDLEQNIRLTFYTQVGRREFPLLGSVLAEASRNILEIQVVGTLDEPVVQQTAFPELDGTLQRLFPDARRRGSTLPTLPSWFTPTAAPGTGAGAAPPPAISVPPNQPPPGS